MCGLADGVLCLSAQKDGGTTRRKEDTPQPQKSLQQLLEEQPIDDTHDAFLIDTGGELGTLLVAAELAMHSI